jgi:hypothetical protein
MQERSLLPDEWNVPAIFRARLGEMVGRKRLMLAQGHLLLVLHAAPVNDDHERHS